MFFHKSADINSILELIKPKLAAVLKSTPYGVDIDIKKHTKTRSVDQNRYLFAIYKHIVEFWQETGFIIDGLKLRFLSSEFLHEYFKARFDLKTTTKLSTAEFMNYTNSIQNLMLEQTFGHYDPIYPEERFQEF